MDAPFPLNRHHPPPPTPPLKAAPGETLFRILCPVSKTGCLIGKGGAIVRQLREETGAKIRIVDEFLPPCCDERVIIVVGHNARNSQSNSNPKDNSSKSNDLARRNSANGETLDNSKSEEVPSAAQRALIKVFERILKVDEERSEKIEEERKEDSGGSVNCNVVCRLLVPSYQAGCVLGRGGKIVEKIRHETGAQIRVFPRSHIPACAWPGDELIQLTGNFQAVKKALLSVSSCLEDSLKEDAFLGDNTRESFPQRGHSSGLHGGDYHCRVYATGPAPERIEPELRIVQEEVVFKLLCPIDKVGSLIGKGGCVVRAIENETGASIKIADAVAPDSNERVVVIAARENMELQRSPAQDAVIRVHSRISELGFEPAAAVVARLLVHSRQMGCLLGRGGIIIAEMRRLTGASIRVFGREQGSKYSTQNVEVVQITGSLQSVHDALFQITCRLREISFASRPSLYNASGSAYFTGFPELPPPLFRPRHDPHSPGHYPSPIGFRHGFDNFSAGQVQAHPTPFSHGMDRIGASKSDQFNNPYGPMLDRPPSPRTWIAEAVSSGNPGRISDIGSDSISGNGHLESGGQPLTKTTAEVVVPQALLSHVYGENNDNLTHIRQFSGANVAVHDPKPGATEGVVTLSGTPNQLRAAQSLIQAFILCGQTF
ncbi:hypothetical protein Nepgr_005706 [Nepenthes gracilis]|uniref:K Homology domain-containing protein n=1 Tax=Nepenthes gracilis TaxID=150966 RepID=A0AAD3XGP5_NEPGR|nr:hypothetical protein Nepgr_005706 [Nepenthes gracilis]